MKFYLNNNYFFVTCRTFNQESIFSEDSKKQIILDKIRKIGDKFKIKFEAYSILSNHYHLLFFMKKGVELRKVLQAINGGISYELNKFGKKYTSIWEKYFNKNVFDQESYLNVIGYIKCNWLYNW